MTGMDDIWMPQSDAEKTAVLAQMEQIASDPIFRNSTNCVKFLRYIVQCALRDDCENIKERVVGVEVFGRSADYDVTQDHVVRATAAEVRKRIAMYYCQPSHNNEIRIDLQPGNYIPRFRLVTAVEDQNCRPDSSCCESLTTVPIAGKPWWRSWQVALSCLILLIALAWVIKGWQRVQSVTEATKAENASSSIDLFWKPFVDSPSRLLLCVGSSSSSNRQDAASVPTVRALAIGRLANFLGLKGKEIRLRGANSLVFQDLLIEPNILVGGFDNPWAMIELKRFRYTLEQRLGSKQVWIEDRSDLNNRQWSVDTQLPANTDKDEYAIVVRLVNSSTRPGQPILTLAGLTPNGTNAAIDCVQKRMCIDAIAQRAPKDWPSRNLEIIIAAQVINGQPGPSRVLSVVELNADYQITGSASK
jgi:hypothetical protein